ncbi:putative inorganic phosphate cotransporter [Photinus pyralis]|uniref:Major facilitator superfamily (MFS) profile domain-containing protein n=2 Tax=Photinus pyralis TaxID=7054 RepID=A0A1Y1LE57_PHOPY|nr:putative inorganic phosphate cotransporter [Photinus pyralis]
MLTGWRLYLSKCFIIPHRYIVAIMGFLAILNAYTMRTTLSIAITEMVIPRNSTSSGDHGCQVEGDSEGDGPIIKNPEDLYDWDETTQGLILSSFYWGYVITHMPGGILAEKFGGKYSLGIGILSTAVFTLITPAVTRLVDGDWRWLCALRVCVGLGEGTTFPAINALLAKWVPLSERSRLGSLTFAGSLLGTVLGTSLSGILIKETQDWASVFYFFGGFGVVWFVIWTLMCYSDPESHPFISDKEKNFLRKELANVSNENNPIPWKAILTSVPLWALIAAQIGHDWGFFAMVTDLPKYMKDILKFKIDENGLWSSLPYVLMWIVSLGSGWLCDWIIKKEYMGITFARKFFTTVASMGPAVFIVGASYSGCDRYLAVALFTIAMGLMGTFYCGMKVNALDLSPNFAGTLMAIVNGIGAISGIITPYLIGALTTDHTLEEWQLVFWITLGVFTVTNIIYVIFASGETQWWNNVDKSETGTVDNTIDTALGKTVMHNV